MSPGPKHGPIKIRRKSHAEHRHNPPPPPDEGPPAPPSVPPPDACPHVALIVAIDALGWRIVALLPSISDGGAALWHVTIARVDGSVRVTATAADLDAALEDLLRYASADAPEER